ncbi:MAG: topoisomerase, partial [Enterovirga sp.]|nr:topoisomerase [Enterovirga sp.]
VDLVMTKEAGGGRGGRTNDPGKPLGDDPETARPIVVKAGRYGPYVTDGETNATLPKDKTSEDVTLADAVLLLAARRAAGPSKPKRGAARGGARAPAKSAKAASGKTTKAAKPAAKAAKPKAAAAKKAKAKA